MEKALRKENRYTGSAKRNMNKNEVLRRILIRLLP